MSGKRASRSTPRGTLATIGDLGFEQFVQQILIGPATVARLTTERRRTPLPPV
jgi:hypothetical protein